MDHLGRMKVEADELKQKCTALGLFINESEIFKSLKPDEQVRMCKQMGFMESYLIVLNERIFACENPN